MKLDDNIEMLNEQVRLLKENVLLREILFLQSNNILLRELLSLNKKMQQDVVSDAVSSAFAFNSGDFISDFSGGGSDEEKKVEILQEIANQLDALANAKDEITSDPDVPEHDRKKAAKKRQELRNLATKIRLEAIRIVINLSLPLLGRIKAATDEANAVVEKIEKIKVFIEFLAATIKFATALLTGDDGIIVPALDEWEQVIATI